MKSIKKRATGTQRLHAALADTDPASTDLILLHPAGFHPALRLPPLSPERLLPRRACVNGKTAARPA